MSMRKVIDAEYLKEDIREKLTEWGESAETIKRVEMLIDCQPQYTKNIYYRHKASGKCAICGREMFAEDTAYCYECRKTAAKRQREYVKRKELKQCTTK